MTREEAIKVWLPIISPGVNNMPELKEALDMAIQALKQESSRSAEITQYRHDCKKLMEENERLKKALEQEPCDDAISRQDTLKTIIKHLGIRSEEYLLPAEEAIYKVVKNMPPVTPQQNVGKWIYDKTIENWRCSECNETPRTMGYVGTADFMAKHFSICNHCGAKMERSDKE